MVKDERKVEGIFYSDKGENLELHAIRLKNGLFISISIIEEPKMGTVALSVPFSTSLVEAAKKHSLEKKRATSTTVFGSRNEIYAKALAEKLTINTGMINYLSINFQEKGEEHFTEAMKLIEELIKKINKNSL